MQRHNRKSPIEKRLAELDRQSHLVRHDMKLLRHALEHPEEGVPWNRLKLVRERRDGSESPAPPDAAGDEADGTDRPAPADGDDLFSWRQRRGTQPGQSGGKPRRRAPRRQVDQRFASYLASGGFSSSGPQRVDRRVQRNKAVFMVLIVLIVAFVIIRLLQ